MAVRDKPAHRIAIKEQLGGQVNVFYGDVSEPIRQKLLVSEACVNLRSWEISRSTALNIDGSRICGIGLGHWLNLDT